jgi:putative addiction module component (TIGR02574 family)
MESPRDAILQQALRLDEGERVALAEQLLASALGSNPAIDAAWRDELTRRIEQIERSEVSLVNGEEVMRRVRRVLRDKAA